MENKIIYDLPEEEYFENESISNSYLQRFDICPAMTKIKLESKSMDNGKMAHKYILEGEKVFKNMFCILPEGVKPGSSKAYQELKKENPDKILITSANYTEQINIMKIIECNIENWLNKTDSVMYDAYKSAKNEVSLFWDQGIICKGRVDKLNIEHPINYIFDLKSCRDLKKFYRSVTDYKYYRQMAFYAQGLSMITGHDIEKIKPVLIAFEVTPPFGTIAFTLSPEYIEFGMEKNTESIMKLVNYDGSNPLYPYEVITLEKPDWLS
jgi:hypothetical protein